MIQSNAPVESTDHLFDAVIVGAGPAGSSAAYHLARDGWHVLLVDRAHFPREKSCGDAVMPPAVEELALMGLTDEMQKRFTLVSYVGTSLRGQTLRSTLLEGGTVGYVAPREQFDALLRENALRHGSVWLDSVVVHDYTYGNSCTVVHGTRNGQALSLRTKLVIAADGSGSRLVRKAREKVSPTMGIPALALTSPQDDRARLTAMRGYFRGIEGLDTILEFYFPQEIGNFYFWIFPIGQGLANVGVLMSMEHLRRMKVDFKQALLTFLSSAQMKQRTERATLVTPLRAAPIAAGLRGTLLFGERLLCVGDAAALVNPSSAEGISAALWSGRMAAKTATDALRRDDMSSASLSTYGQAIHDQYQHRYEQLLANLSAFKHE